MTGFCRIIPVPCHWGVMDNYSYVCVLTEQQAHCVIVDACEATPLLRTLRDEQLTPVAILTTHHHWDHVGANEELVERFGVEVFGHQRDRDRIPALTRAVQGGETFEVRGVGFRALHVPGHTQGSVVYQSDKVAFTGDTLFCGGCGRLLEGSAEQLHASLEFLARDLPSETVVYTGHEYTQKNLQFAASLVNKAEIDRRLSRVVQERAQNECCAFGTMAEERATNLFLMCRERDVQKAILGERFPRIAQESLALATFTRLRALKDQA